MGVRKYPQLTDAAWLRQRYEVEQLSLEAIAKEVGGAAPSTVWKALGNAGILCRAGNREYARDERLHSKEWLEDQYVTQNKTAEAIAEEFGLSLPTLRTRLSMLSLRKRPGSYEKKDKTLPQGVMFKPHYKRKGGYLLQRAPDHPFCNGSGYVLQHRLICEEALGRYLTADEQCHHLNEVKSDNRIENLLVVPNFAVHRYFHNHPPEWVPRCDCCGRPRPEMLKGRPEGIGLLWGYDLPVSGEEIVADEEIVDG